VLYQSSWDSEFLGYFLVMEWS
jgi:hypothetical protein